MGFKKFNPERFILGKTPCHVGNVTVDCFIKYWFHLIHSFIHSFILINSDRYTNKQQHFLAWQKIDNLIISLRSVSIALVSLKCITTRMMLYSWYFPILISLSIISIMGGVHQCCCKWQECHEYSLKLRKLYPSLYLDKPIKVTYAPLNQRVM